MRGSDGSPARLSRQTFEKVVNGMPSSSQRARTLRIRESPDPSHNCDSSEGAETHDDA